LEIAPDLVVLPSSSAAVAVLSGPLRSLLAPVPMLAIGSKTEQAAWREGAHTVIRSHQDSVASVVAEVLALLGPMARPRLESESAFSEATEGRVAE
jgi:uroporphyrinogen-III synthase